MKKKIIIALIVLVVAAAAYFIFKPAGDAVDKRTKMSQRNISVVFRETGSVSPRNRLQIQPPFAGRIEEILVNEGDHVKKGQVLMWMSSSERAAMIDAARQQGPEEYKRWTTIYKPTPIPAPMDGFIILRQNEPGQTVATTDAPLVMADQLIVESDVDETDLRYIRLGDKLDMSLDAYPDETFQGIVEHVAYESQVISNVTVYLIKIRPIKEPAVFRSGMTATITVPAESKDNAWSIPNSFITDRSGKKFVTVEKGKGVFETRQIQPGITDGRWTEVASGLTQDETIVTFKAQAKQKTKSFMSR